MVEADSDHLSPDGRIRVSYHSDEMRMSLWVHVPHVVDVESGRTLFKPHSNLISGSHEWGEDGSLTLNLSHYPDGGNQQTVHFDFAKDSARLGEDGPSGTISEAARLVEREFLSRRPSPALAPGFQPRSQHKPENPVVKRLLDTLAVLTFVGIVGGAVYLVIFGL